MKSVTQSVAGLVLLGATLLLGSVALASPEQEQEKQTRRDPGNAVQRMDRIVDLTPEQEAQLKPILEDQAAQVKAIRNDSSLSQEERRARMQEIRQAGQERTGQILTQEQQQKLSERRSTMQNRQGRTGQGRSPRNRR